MGRLGGRIILITGASRGLGAALAVACAAEGARLVLTARTRGGLEEVDDAARAKGADPATLVTLDLADHAKVDALGAGLFERFGRLDGFVACAAGIAPLTLVAHEKPATFARLMTVNALANQRLIRTLDPLLRASPAGRAVFVTDRVAREHRAYWGSYASSKMALEAIALAYAAETRITAIRVTLFSPPPMATRLRAQAFPGDAAGRAADPTEVAPAIVPLLEPTSSRHGEVVTLERPTLR